MLSKGKTSSDPHMELTTAQMMDDMWLDLTARDELDNLVSVNRGRRPRRAEPCRCRAIAAHCRAPLTFDSLPGQDEGITGDGVAGDALGEGESRRHTGDDRSEDCSHGGRC